MTIASTTNRYDKYKDSGIEWIGEIPSTKNIFRSKYYLVYQKGKNPSILNTDKVGVPYIGASDLDDISGNANYENYTTEEFLPVAQKNDVLILWDGARAGKKKKNHSGVISSTIVNLLTNEKYINKNFLYFYLKGFENFLYDRVNGTTIPHMNRKYIEELEFIDFSLKEQEAIAGYLDRKCGAIDETIEKQKSVIEKLKEYKQSIITQAVTKGLDKSAPMKDSGIEWIGQIPQHWEICKLLKLFKDRKCPNKGNVEHNVLSLSYGNIKRRNVETNMGLLPESFESYNIIEPDNIVLRLTDLQNDHKSLRCGLVKERGIITSAYVTLELKDTSQCANYYYRLLHTFDIEKGFYGMGAGVRQSLKYDGELCNLYIIKPPVAEQKQIAEFLDKKCSEIDKTIEDKEKLIEKLVEYKKSLIYECVTGKRKVVA